MYRKIYYKFSEEGYFIIEEHLSLLWPCLQGDYKLDQSQKKRRKKEPLPMKFWYKATVVTKMRMRFSRTI